MYIKHGKPVFTRRDMWYLDETLNPILLAAMKKFKGELLLSKKEGSYGTPTLCYEELGFGKQMSYTPEQEEAAANHHLEILDSIIYAFDPTNRPCLGDYGVSFEMITSSPPDENGLRKVCVECNDQEAYDQYNGAIKEHYRLVKKGLQLFGKYYLTFWT